MIVLLDGPVGTELAARGVPTPPPLWSAAAIEAAPEVVGAIHRDYALAGATVHTAATFRATPRAAGARFRELTARAVAITRAAVPAGHRVAGSVAPIEDCYRPDLSPARPRAEHDLLVRALADAGVDLLLCETFPHAGEAIVAVEAAVATGLPVWVAFTAGPAGTLFTPAAMRDAARAAVAAGAAAVLCNCVAATRTHPFVESLKGLGVPFGAYANAGPPGDALGWVDAAPGDVGDASRIDRPRADARRRAAAGYARHAARWVAAGATLVGGCCGTGPEHVAALARLARAGNTQET